MLARIEILKKINYAYPEIFENKFHSVLKKWFRKGQIGESFKYFIDPQTITEWANLHYYDYANFIEEEYYNMPYMSDKSLHPFIVFDWYAGYVHQQINNQLRFNLSENFIFKKISVLTNEIDKFSIKENLVVVRRIKNSVLKKYLANNKKIKPGVIFFDAGFLSTSLNINYRLNNNSDYKPLNNETLLIIKVPKETKGVYLEFLGEAAKKANREEYELLLQRGTKMIVEDRVRILNNNIILTEIIV